MNIDLLKRIAEIEGAPGFEDPVRKLVISEIEGIVDHMEVDNLGNLIAKKNGRSSEKPVMVGAHLDEIGFIVTHIDDRGFLKFHTLGGFDPKTLVAQRVIVHGKKKLTGVMGSKPIHVMSPEERTKPVKISDFYIDLGLPVEEVKELVEVGVPVTRDRELIQMGDCVNCKSLDNRVSVFILIETLKQLKGQEIPFDFYAVFTVQEEVGIRGANVAAHKINPYFGLGLDTTIAYDLPGAQKHEYVTSLGEGVGIKIMDASTICDTRMVSFLKGIANTNEIVWQLEILTAGGTDTAGIQRMGEDGAIAGAISIPTRHIHSVIEMVHTQDVQGAIDLLTQSILNLDSFNETF